MKEKELKSNSEKESNKEKDSDTMVAEKEEKPKKVKHTGAVTQEGMTNGLGAFIPFENGKLSGVYKDQTKGWKKYRKYADGSIEF